MDKADSKAVAFADQVKAPNAIILIEPTMRRRLVCVNLLNRSIQAAVCINHAAVLMKTCLLAAQLYACHVGKLTPDGRTRLSRRVPLTAPEQTGFTFRGDSTDIHLRGPVVHSM